MDGVAIMDTLIVERGIDQITYPKMRDWVLIVRELVIGYVRCWALNIDISICLEALVQHLDMRVYRM